jgi:hypothetical protein
MPGRRAAVFNPPPDAEAALWRYMDFTRFVSLLDTGALWFCRADRLFDPFEAALPLDGEGKAARERRQRLRRRLMSETVISSWHLNEVESEAMWRLYAGGQGLAVRSRFSKLERAMRRAAAGFDELFVGAVRYIDYTSARMPRGDTLWPFIHKRESFEHEREVRVVAQRRGRGRTSFPAGGYSVRVDLHRLIDAVYLAPDVEPWFERTVRAATRRFGWRFRVERSALEAAPVG